MQIVRESFFMSAIRSFCNALFSMLGIIVGLAVVVLLVGLLLASHLTPPSKAEFTIGADAEGRRDVLPMTAPVILHIDIVGEIGKVYLTGSVIKEMLLDSREGLLKGDRIKAILLHMDTPGGLAFDADEIYRHLMHYKKQYNIPIYAYVEGLCASGGMYVTAAADKVYASPSSVIGSIGVILGPNFNFSGLMDRYGISQVTLTEGKDKDMLNPFRPWKPGEDQSLININAYMYERFVSIMTTARTRLDKDKLINEYGAQVYCAPEAAELGYIDDGNSDYDTALADLAKAAQIPETERYQVIQVNPVRHLLRDLVYAKNPLNITHRIELDSYSEAKGRNPLLLLYQ